PGLFCYQTCAGRVDTKSMSTNLQRFHRGMVKIREHIAASREMSGAAWWDELDAAMQGGRGGVETFQHGSGRGRSVEPVIVTAKERARQTLARVHAKKREARAARPATYRVVMWARPGHCLHCLGRLGPHYCPFGCPPGADA